jgi:putative restriction endonuclease
MESKPAFSKKLKVGAQYTREEVIKILGYKAVQAIQKGVVTPKGTDAVIIFISEEKAKGMTPYADKLVNRTVYWEGAQGHQSDQRVVKASGNIHVFYRQLARGDFRYMGRAIIKSCNILDDKPSEFVFSLQYNSKRR